MTNLEQRWYKYLEAALILGPGLELTGVMPHTYWIKALDNRIFTVGFHSADVCKQYLKSVDVCKQYLHSACGV